MKITPDPFIPLKEGQSSIPMWMSITSHPPTPGKVYSVKLRDGEPFNAWLDARGNWWTVLPDANNDGTRELGEKLTETMNLKYVRRIFT